MRAVTLRPRRVQRPFREGGDTGVGDGDDVKLLLVEDDDKIAGAVRRGLAAEGYTVDVAPNGDDGLWMATEGAYDLILLDIMLPRRSGYRVCADLRAAGDWTPILMLTAKDGDLDEAEALDTGADDYLVKPFSLAELLARLRALVRRGHPERPVEIEVGDLRLDPATRRVWRGDAEVHLSPKEFALLETFMRRPDEVLTPFQLLESAWDFGYENKSNVVQVYVRYLREKIDRPFGARSIETVRGAGYRLGRSEPS
jgi:two-component system, OmpR family, response regulator